MYKIYTPAVKKQIVSPDSYEKGRMFERYIIELFNSQHFQLKQYRESRRFAGVIPEGHSYPDIEMELVFSGKHRYRFAVECKWRSKINENGNLRWAENDNQVMRYRKFQDCVRIPVFIAIGIGGLASKPDKLFVTPLINICDSNYVHESQLIPFKRKPTRKFYFDYIQSQLF